MAEGGGMEKSKTLKCRKCRLLLLEEPPNRIMETAGAGGGEDGANVFSIYEDCLPQWISDSVEEVRVTTDQ